MRLQPRTALYGSRALRMAGIEPARGCNAQIADNSGLPGERAKSTRGGNLSKAETRHKAQTGSDYTAVCGGKELLKDALHFSLDSDRYEYSVDGSRFEIQL